MNFHEFFKNSGFRLVFCKKSKILYISATKWGCPIASYLPIARLGAAIRITDCIVPDWFPDSIYWPAMGGSASLSLVFDKLKLLP